jgi:cytoskeletal protein CcmA (bactofilin family)
MINFNRKDRAPDVGEVGKNTLRPAIYEPPGVAPVPSASTANRNTTTAVPTLTTPAPASSATPAPNNAAAADGAAVTAMTGGSILSVGVNIKLKGVEISDCDSMVIEGHVEATVNSKAMQIAKPGALKGTALIDVAEIHGTFEGELTARTRLIVHGTGRVSGTIRYGKLIVAEGGELNGDVKRLDSPSELH